MTSEYLTRYPAEAYLYLVRSIRRSLIFLLATNYGPVDVTMIDSNVLMRRLGI